MVLVTLAGDVVLVHPVVGEDADGALVAAFPQDVDIIGQNLTDTLDVVEHSDCLANELANPYCHSVSSGTGAAQVEKRSEGQERIGCDMAYSSLRLGFRELAGEICALECLGIATFPDVVVTLGVVFQVKQAL